MKYHINVEMESYIFQKVHNKENIQYVAFSFDQFPSEVTELLKKEPTSN